jgi:non-specific serine/threonine protein kinase/serine/threonine-protein kinase
MTPETWSKVRTLVEGALAVPAVERSAWLATQTSDAEVLTEAEQLLSFEHEASQIFASEMPNWDAAVPPIETDMTGQTVGHYRLVEEIGRGGMGTVYLAVRSDGTYEQRVALKILQESIFTVRLAERFAVERQILARLTHPGIARLLDGGVTTDGRPYLVLEYVEGRTIDRYCAEENLSIGARLKLFLKVAAAVQSAHQQLILHLDIKPANILVTAEGEPKLLDFGISRVLSEQLEGASLTESTLRLLTPKYSSPEQAEGRPLGVASDVFSLATLLYRLLTGRLPYDIEKAMALEAARIIREQSPLPPSKAAPEPVAEELRGDLDTILLQALRKEPERRYGTVMGFAEDVERYLAFEPVRAHPDSLAYRASKFVRRNRVYLGIAAAVLLIIAGSVTAVVHSAIVARQQQQLAERRFQDVRKLAHSYIFDLDGQLTEIPGTVKVRKLVLQNALAYLESMSAEKSQDTDLTKELAKGYMRAALVQSRVGVPSLSDEAGAKQSLLKSLALLRKAFDQNPNDAEARLLLLTNLRLLADEARTDSDLKQSEEYGRQAWEIGQPLLQDHPRKLPLEALMRVALVLAQNRGAQSEGATLGDPQGALPWLDRLRALAMEYKALPTAEQVPHQADSMLRHEMIVRASVMRQLQRKPEARAIYEQALVVSQQLVGTSISGTVGDMVLHYTYAEFLLETHDAQRASQVVPPVKPVLLMEDGANRTQLAQTGDLLALHARIDIERKDLVSGKAKMQQCMDTFEALHAQKPGDGLTNDQMATSFFDIAQEPNLDLASRHHLFERGLEVIQPGLAAAENMEERSLDAEGRLRWANSLPAGAPQRAKLIDAAQTDLRIVLAKMPDNPDALEMTRQSEALRSGKTLE